MPIERITGVREYEIKIIFRRHLKDGRVEYYERLVYDCGVLAYQEKIQGRMWKVDNSPVRNFEQWLLGESAANKTKRCCYACLHRKTMHPFQKFVFNFKCNHNV